ncbi:hypothetical protein SAMN04488020_12024 [Palleronia marisminoris]|uniref:Plasmid recombination enzyme n=1 Tax=Palleronia marisminoris TaxID=315423 RepID=A0A1Y5TTC3_9RHOB|nr:plasmid recombination protein [Palleronia marisminoris]SFH52871.1 hypothetical protein SAMN04488020_12024 [Palleronia marisminoris]SLN71672.1 hypothetical protein PAM7066_03684 [Palleronia marisminoris]
MDGSHTPKAYPIVMRMAGMVLSDLRGYEMHGLRKGGDLSHADPSPSKRNKRFIGEENWVELARERVTEMALENHVAEIESLKARNRKKDLQRRLLEGPKDPWRPTSHGPLREIILTANSEWFDDAMAKFMGENREADFLACANKWLLDTFGADVIHARYDRDEAAFHVHAVIFPETTVEMTRKNKVTGVSEVIATRRMLQPSRYRVIENYELGQDSVGEAFAHLMLIRGERRAAAIKEAREAGGTLLPRRQHARTTQWRAEQELAIAKRERAVSKREDQVVAREVDADAVLCAAEMIGSGQIEIDEGGSEVDLRPTMALDACHPTKEKALPPQLVRALAARKRVARIFAPMLARLRKKAEEEAQGKLTREVAELRTAWASFDGILASLPENVRAGLGDALKSVTRNLTVLRRYGGTEKAEAPPKKTPDPR